VLALLLLGALLGAIVLAGRPLGRLQRQIAEVEGGTRSRLQGPWPSELVGVTGGLNALLATEQERLERYRATLGNLAHSLKTPLAALRGLVEAPAALEREAVAPQVDRMQDIVQYQLKRAVMGGGAATLAAVPVAPVLEDLRQALAKVYADRRVAIDLAVDPAVAYPIDRSDLFELVGNLLDNACKYGRSRVRLAARTREEPQWRRPGLELTVEDDGPGIAPPDRDRVLERGARADERVAGQGIGLSVVRDVAAAYGGSVAIDASTLGGALLTVTLPGR
jgi:two-component system sensor histidine kinase PhoQ